MGATERTSRLVMAEANRSVPPEKTLDPALAEIYTSLLAQLRSLCFFTSKGQSDPKPFLKNLRGASYEVRRHLALQGPRDGLAIGVLRYFQALELTPEDRLKAFVACAESEPERSLEFLETADLSPEENLMVLEMAMTRQPILDFEEFKKIEVLYFMESNDETSSGRELRQRYDQAKGKRHSHKNKHILRLIPKAVRQHPPSYFRLLKKVMTRDPFGTMDFIRSASQDPLQGNPLENLNQEQRLALLKLASSYGFGYASSALDLFNIPDEPENYEQLKKIFIMDCTASGSLYGLYAFEGAKNYPFGLNNIEPAPPRKYGTPEALEYLKENDPFHSDERSYSSTEIGNAITLLQDQEFKRFIEQLRNDIALQWKAFFPEIKREIVFGDPELKIRNIIFLIANAVFQSEHYFKKLYSTIQETLPNLSEAPEKLRLMTNRYYFLEVIGLNPSQLFSARRSDSPRSPIEDVKDFQIRFLLQVGMSIYIHVENTLFQSTPIAWNMLLNQSEGKLDTPMQEVAQLFDSFDILFTIVKPLVPDLREWVATIVNALVDEKTELPMHFEPEALKSPLRLTTRASLARHRKTVNQFCLQALQWNADRSGISTTAVVQGLRLPRIKTDRLFAMLQEDKKKKQEES